MTAGPRAQLLAQAERWLEDDPDPETQAELRALIDSMDTRPSAAADLTDRFAGTLEFGTAGLRGVLGAGPNRMNRAVVLRTTWGLGTYLTEALADAGDRGVVIGFDGRTLSRELAEDAAAALSALGLRVALFRALEPTPMVAFAVRRLGAAAGVMVTASHNPPEYNGYKVYAGNGAQIIPPMDREIAGKIDQAPAARAVPRLALDDARSRGLLRDLGEDLELAYLEAVRGMVAAYASPGRPTRDLKIVYTPLHGVGDRLARRALAEAGFTDVATVAEQQAPDGRFPTVAFPNPEEAGAMDLAYALGTERGADLILANDPDADRLSVAVPIASGGAGATWLQLTGNQVGVLLGHHLLTQPAAPGEDVGKRLAVTTVVSSPMLGAMARALGARYEETYTGFKWIANRAMELEAAEGLRPVIGYEEALGYAVGDVVRDKDGISAAVMVAEIAAALRARGVTLPGYLEEIARRHGHYVSRQVNLTRKGREGQAAILATMARLRAAAPTRVGPLAVTAVIDYMAHPRLPPSNVLTFELEGPSRVVARPSGTEPKIKFYFDVRVAAGDGEPFIEVDRRAQATLSAVVDAFLEIAG